MERLALPPKTIKYIAGCDPYHDGDATIHIFRVIQDQILENINYNTNKVIGFIK